MKLPNPITFNDVYHKHGAKVLRITGIDHDTAKPVDGRSQDTWWFEGDLKWPDDAVVREMTDIMPYHLCTDTEEGKKEIDMALKVLNVYLAANGKWCNSSSNHEGWYANERK